MLIIAPSKKYFRTQVLFKIAPSKIHFKTLKLLPQNISAPSKKSISKNNNL